ncbi:DAK2 domain-containing protein [Metamycoplasma hyosynoviae]|uniref:DAK2 domain-containing protein n=1 Tax=Metamycoplasma hyosynoviae TaxID=29559 RepID=UPI00235A29B1|nr:DAK2 domain-containing protein [Metamycoplasma hyosynoviae]MDC8918256.1 DAK2 domain-containing protein [Metamycoplasma hyosynoviae]MDC8921590.1 DAK2 domain-containing protein [Metamycoplasma hyosynoviae]MDD1365911.1 DAK2 domain-containing protein [Metamycoplasma hyosynoviae]MDD7847958.1 DAK2 domain-containing protein [Metamycoplasma hyosynoviae]
MKRIDGKDWGKAIISAANNLYNKKDVINALNIFPVPDGDTGLNMTMTITAAKDALENVSNNDIYEIAKTVSQNMLLGARGNSGVILSQIFKGFSDSFSGKTSIDSNDLREAFASATTIAYKAVLKPVEGTILTVIRETSENLNKIECDNLSITEMFEHITKFARQSCDNTPNLLPILKEVGVTDSGGEGLYTILNGMYSYFLGTPIEINKNDTKEIINKFISDSEVFNGEFGYCTEFIVEIDNIAEFDKDYVVKKLEKKGNSLVVVNDENILKVHIHTQRPGSILNFGNKFGQFVKVKIENMTLQANESKSISNNLNNNKNNNGKSKQKEFGIISCNTGKGIIDILKNDYSVDYIIEGGQTNNPSIKDIVYAIENVNAKTIFFFPNNSNIILSAQQASKIQKNKKIIIIPTKSEAQILPILTNFSSENTKEENHELFKFSLKNTSYAEIVKAVKDAKLYGKKVKRNSFMSLVNGKLIESDKTDNGAAIMAINEMITDETQVVTIIYGQETSEASTKELQNYIEATYDVEVQIVNGGQKIYSYFISAE